MANSNNGFGAGVLPDPPAGRAPFPHTREEFTEDERVSFSKEINRFILEAEDGTEWEFNEPLGRWQEAVDQSQIDQYLMGNGGTTLPSTAAIEQSESKKRKLEDDPELQRSLRENQGGQHAQKRAKPDNPAKQVEPSKQKEPQQKTIYVTNLPKDATLREVVAFFGKAGMIAETINSSDETNQEESAKDEDVEYDTDTGVKKRRPEDMRVKLYREEDGTLKGDALITYFSENSIPTAIMLFDERFFQDEDKGQGKMSVKLADPSYKRNKDGPAFSNPKDKKLAQKKVEEMKKRLGDWGDEPAPPPIQPKVARHDTVILKHMFTLDELKRDPEARKEIEEDIKDEADKYDRIVKVVLYDREPDGIVTVRFEDEGAAENFAKNVHGRKFGGMPVEASFAKGHERFKKSRKRDESDDERVNQFGDVLELDEDDSED